MCIGFNINKWFSMSFFKERNASKIYKARQVLLGLEEDAIEAEIPDTYIIRFNSIDPNLNSNGDGVKDGNMTKINNMAPYGVFSKYSNIQIMIACVHCYLFNMGSFVVKFYCICHNIILP